MEDIVIKVENVSKDFKLVHERNTTIKSRFVGMLRGKKSRTSETQHALKNVSFEIKKGEFFGIVGRNGSGKSTLLKMLAGIYQPSKGKIKVEGKLVPFIELGVGFNPELTGRENVYLNGSILGFSRKEVDAFYSEVVEFAELGEYMDKKLKNYSSGMQVRLAFSMAVRAKADILLIDEVLAVGDADFQRKCYDYFRKLKKDRKTVVFVSHDMAAIKEFCDRAALIENSKLTKVSGTTEITQAYNALFMNDSNEGGFNQLQTEMRQGSGAVQIIDAKLDKGVYTAKDAKLEMQVTLRGVSSNSHLMTGFSVKNAEGQFLNNNHTWEEGLELPSLESDKTCSIKWVWPNVYENGVYTIDVYACGKENEVYDRLQDAVTFKAKRINRSGSLVALEANARLVRNDKNK